MIIGIIEQIGEKWAFLASRKDVVKKRSKRQNVTNVTENAVFPLFPDIYPKYANLTAM